jgi:hypothetical protein
VLISTTQGAIAVVAARGPTPRAPNGYPTLRGTHWGRIVSATLADGIATGDVNLAR